MKSIVIIFVLSVFVFSCTSENKIETPYEKEINGWHAKRIEALKERSPWLRLAGLFWLEDGESTFGSSRNNKIIFPSDLPEQIGTFIRRGNKVNVKINEGINVIADSLIVKETEMIPDIKSNPTVLSFGNYSWYVIEREEMIGIRLLNEQNPELLSFEGIERYPVDPEWEIECDYIPYDPPKIIEIPSVIGTVSRDSCYGRIEFEREGKTHSFEPTGKNGNFFAVFADKTNGEETYGAGRFLVISDSVKDGKITVDFNRAYNPPCAFSKYATCPLPPKQNYLYLEITAGEKIYHTENAH
ncbi:MAG: DUF1684 domain-containing protein [Melioribacteraceae bacterium]|nr:DUF1684 domain-containing protein [Melioribacteraceae bacterium]MDD3558012.1 DUF1684 domain-containing protein [Melioribacteraceae bacterium]